MTTTKLKVGRRYRVTQQLTYGDRVGPVGAMAEVADVDEVLNTCSVDVVCDDGAVFRFSNVKASRLELLVGKPYCAALGDMPRANFGGRVMPAGFVPSFSSTPASEAPMHLASTPDVASALATLQAALSRPAATVDLTPVHNRLDHLDADIDHLRAAVAPVLDLAGRLASATPVERARIEITAKASSNPVLSKLLPYYTPGVASRANVCLAAPPSIGKTFAVREMGKGYDLYLEHGCTDDIDEIATMLGGPVPDGKGGFLVVDGVATQAVRAAASGQTVLLLLDEVFRLGEQQQQWWLSFLTGVKTPDGLVYRLRTRKVDNGVLEVIECPAANLHLVACTNLGARTPVEAFWSRWEVIRIAFDPTTVENVAAAIAASYGIEDAPVLASRFAGAVVVARAGVADGSLRYPLDLRALERACQIAAPTADAICKFLADRVSDLCAHWGVDSGETDPASTSTVSMVRSALGVA